MYHNCTKVESGYLIEIVGIYWFLLLSIDSNSPKRNSKKIYEYENYIYNYENYIQHQKRKKYSILYKYQGSCAEVVQNYNFKIWKGEGCQCG